MFKKIIKNLKKYLKIVVPPKCISLYTFLKIASLRLFFRRQMLEINNRSTLKLQDIDSLSKDIPHFIYKAKTVEKYIQNDFYGIATVLKKNIGISQDYHLKMSIEHGLYIGGYVWDEDITTPFPAVVTFSNNRKRCLQKKTDKNIYPIGPYIHYANQYFDEEVLRAEKTRLGRSLLIFPAHSTHYNIIDFDHSNLFNMIKEKGKQFDSVRVCLYWKEIIRGIGKLYRQNNIECVSAGHIYDPLFLSRLKSIISLSDVTMSNQIGTHIGYCVFMNKPHILFSEKVKISQTDKSMVIPSKHADIDELQSDRNEIENAFSTWTQQITPEQQRVVNKFWGLESIRTPDEIASFVKMSEDEYRNKRHLNIK